MVAVACLCGYRERCEDDLRETERPEGPPASRGAPLKVSAHASATEQIDDGQKNNGSQQGDEQPA
jgi:hypothetical protein